MRKGVVLVVVIGIMMVMFILGLVVLYLMTQESRLAEHKIKRNRAFFAAQAATVHAMARLRQGHAPEDISRDDLNNLGDPADQGYPIDVDIEIGDPIDAPGTAIHGTREINATVNY
jgi:hypothetical protein